VNYFWQLTYKYELCGKFREGDGNILLAGPRTWAMTSSSDRFVYGKAPNSITSHKITPKDQTLAEEVTWKINMKI
jgi:hypothetical protein